MAFIRLTTSINAPVEACFNLSRSIDVHLHSMQHHQERVVAGITTGLINLHETVTWQARHLGVLLRMTVKLTELQFPAFFSDQMISGPFKLMRHYHYFRPQGNYTLMIDEFVFKSPLGWLGKLADKLFLKRYLKRLLQQRNQVIKQLAEQTYTPNHETTTLPTAIHKN